ncbi:MAG: type II toxin-antitoxin system prevent-host-death family antitoxin [Chloroflexota bacterium]
MKTIGAYEAKTHLPRLLDEVAAGETITITKHGVPVATLVPARPERKSARAAADDLRAFRDRHPLNGIKIRDLIEDGRRR